MKQMKLLHHPKSVTDDLIINSKDFPGLKSGDIVEIYLPDDTYSRLLLQVTTLKEDLQKDSISVEQSLATTFQLKPYSDVIVNVVNPKVVALDSVELIFKDHYLARSDMWRWKQAMVNTCVYPKKPIVIHSASRLQVCEMWAHGEQVASGVITEDTKIVYRSASSMVYLFLQMSSEMWDFDINGDLYFEKAVNGFLCDLIARWKEMKCNHDVNIVLFSRVFYEAKSMDQFPLHMAGCVQVDYKGRFYEDFYRVAVQNERIDDWTQTLRLLKTYFSEYPKRILEYHNRPDVKVPTAVISTASQGNFLQVLNMSLNVFEKHFMDRSFDRTGQISVVITPGVGVFEVDRDLTNITKQRIIDNGIGSDLVCLGEQPLHAVPLFKSKNPAGLDMKDDYNMPHWINLSFYSTTSAQSYSKFVPRIKLPTPQPKPSQVKALGTGMYAGRSQPTIRATDCISVVYDYDEYDANIFKGCSPSQLGPKMSTLQRANVRRRSHLVTPPRPLNQDDVFGADTATSSPTYSNGSSHSRSGAISIPRRSASSYGSSLSSTHGNDGGACIPPEPERPRVTKDDMEFVTSPPHRTVVGSAGHVPENVLQEKRRSQQQPRALINPFDPSQVTIKLTSNRRRWTHVFPLGPTGIFMQQHHYQAIPQSSSRSNNLCQVPTLPERPQATDLVKRHAKDAPVRSRALFGSSLGNETPIVETGHSWLWGTTGEQEWTPALTTGVDWKSLVIPACLPVTTDFFPDRHSLQYDYVMSEYGLLSEERSTEITQSRCYRGDEDYKHHKPLTTEQVYQELVCQRLQQGFQIIKLPPKPHSANGAQNGPGHSVLRGHTPHNEEKQEECRMSIGRIFHTISLSGPVITVTQYRPRHASREVKPILYVYNLQAPGSDSYDLSKVIFSSEKLETFNWSYLDHYICIRGEREYGLKETLKYWRLRMLVLPGSQAATRKIIEAKDSRCRCDIYPDFTTDDETAQREAFLKFLEIMNRIRRPLSTKRSKSVGAWGRAARGPLRLSMSHQGSPQLASPQSGSAYSAGAFRNRVSSNRIHDRPKGHHLEHLRADSALAGKASAPADADSKSGGSNSSLEAMQESTGAETAEEKIQSDIKCLTMSTPSAEIVEAMKHASEGICFLPKQGGVPQHSFISAEATAWAKDHVDGAHTDIEATHLFQRLLEESYICHASGETAHPFINGFYIYYLMDKTLKGVEPDDVDLDAYQHEWIEVELLPQAPQNEDSFGDMDVEPDLRKRLLFRNVNIDIDAGGRSDRPEWGQAQYHNIFQPGEAFELIVEWMVATGYIIADLVLGWARKANSQGLQLVPIPSDPFVLPGTLKSDPLRGAIFVPLHVHVLPDPAPQLLKGEGLEDFQEFIVHRFGFISLRDLQADAEHRTYVHTTGGMFVMMPRTLSLADTAVSPDAMAEPLCCEAGLMGPLLALQEEPTPPPVPPKVGYLWSWNYMITKRWKNTATIDEQFMRTVMHDFRALCSDQEGRLAKTFDTWLATWAPGPPVLAHDLFSQMDH